MRFTKLTTLLTIAWLAQGCVGILLGIKPYRHQSAPACQPQTRDWNGFPYFHSQAPMAVGLSDYGRTEQELDRAQELGVKLMRMDFPWRAVVPELHETDLITEEQLDHHPEWVDTLIERLNSTGSWRVFDEKIAWAKARGITVIPILGHGYQYYLPYYNGVVFGPDRVGRERYLGTTALFVRAFVKRYLGTFQMYQIENELNVAAPTMLWGWRLPGGIGALKNADFADWNFLTEIMRMLSQHVRREQPDALLTHNFQTDLPGKLLHQLGQPSWLQAVELWRPYLDVIGIDLYPNYYDADQNYRGLVQERIVLAQKISCQKPVVILETNYPRAPGDRQFDVHKQADYVETAIIEAKAAGAKGILFYGAVSLSLREDNDKFSRADKKLLRRLGRNYEKGSLVGLGVLLLTHQKKMKSGHLGRILTSVEPYWDFYDEVGTPVPAYDILKNANQKVR